MTNFSRTGLEYRERVTFTAQNDEDETPAEPPKDAHEKILAAAREILCKEPHRMEFKRFNHTTGVLEDMPPAERLAAAGILAMNANPKLAIRWKNENGKVTSSSS